jgi:hypothetical protein
VAGGPRSSRPGSPFWLLVLALTAALVVSITVALHYRATAGRTPHTRPQDTSLAVSPLPEVTSVVLRLPAAGGAAGTVVITTAALPGAGRAQFTVSAVITGAMPDTYYNLIGNDCASADGLPDDVWASGHTGADGSADLIGYAWTGAVTDSYWLVLDPQSVTSPPGLHGQFAEGRAAPYPAGQAPCPHKPLRAVTSPAGRGPGSAGRAARRRGPRAAVGAARRAAPRRRCRHPSPRSSRPIARTPCRRR